MTKQRCCRIYKSLPCWQYRKSRYIVPTDGQPFRPLAHFDLTWLQVSLSCIILSVRKVCDKQYSNQPTTSLSDDILERHISHMWCIYCTSVASRTNGISKSEIFKKMPGLDLLNALYWRAYAPMHVSPEHLRLLLMNELPPSTAISISQKAL